VKSMRCMFEGASAFNQNISGWVTTSVIDMSGMFRGASTYNNGGDLLALDTSSVENMDDMFRDASSFKQTANFSSMQRVERLTGMFAGCHADGGCVTRLVNQEAIGLRDQKGRIQDRPVTSQAGRIQAGPATRKRARDSGD
jgi:surface protein